MRPGLNVELLLAGSGRNLLLLYPDLRQQLAALDPQKQTALFDAIATQLRKTSNRRLTLQRDMQGEEFPPRVRRVDYHGKGRGANAYYAGSGQYIVTGTLGGNPYRKIVNRSWSGRYGRLLPSEMLLGFRDRKFLKTTVHLGPEIEIDVGYSGFAGKLASWHNEGLIGSDGKRRTKRNWFGVGIVDRKAIDNLIQQYLSSDS